jgi:hypothetical protein
LWIMHDTYKPFPLQQHVVRLQPRRNHIRQTILAEDLTCLTHSQTSGIS